MMAVPRPAHLNDLEVRDATFACPDLSVFCRLDELRLPQPHQLHRPQPAGNRRLQTPTAPSIAMSRQTRPSPRTRSTATGASAVVGCGT